MKIEDNHHTTAASALIVFHGGGSDGKFMLDFLAPLGDRYRLICPTFDMKFPALEEAFASLNTYLQQNGIKGYNVYGISLGGQIAQCFGIQHARDINKIILSRTCLPDSKRNARLGLKRMLLKLIPENALLKRLNRDFSQKIKSAQSEAKPGQQDLYAPDRVDKAFLINALNLQMGFHNTPWERLSPLKQADMLLLFAENDQIFPTEDHKKMKDFYPEAKTLTMAGHGHSDILFKPEKELKIIKEYLE